MLKKKINIHIIIMSMIMVIALIYSQYRLLIADRVIDDWVFWGINIAFIFFTILFIGLGIYIYNKKDLKPEKALLYIVPIFAILMSITIPVSRGHDEFAHWIRSYEVSEGVLLTPIIDNQAVTTLPKAVQNVVAEREKAVFKYVDAIKLLDVKIDENDVGPFYNPNAATYCFVQYLPQATGINIGQLFTDNPLLLAYMARLVNLITCMIILYFAIKLIPFGKNILLLIATIPIAIEGFTTMSPDGITIAICALFIAYLLNVIFNKEKCGKKEIIILTVIGAIVSLCKIVYLPIVFLSLMIPKNKFESRKKQVLSILTIIMVGVICNLVWLYIGSSVLLDTNTSGSVSKVSTILSMPILYAQKLISTFLNGSNNYFLSLFGGQLEWNEVARTDIIPYILAILALVATFSESKLKNAFNKFQKIIICFVIISIILLIFTSIYIQWSGKDYAYINGVQGRYFLPILCLVLFIVGSLKINTNYKETTITKLICISSYIVQILTIGSIVSLHI